MKIVLDEFDHKILDLLIENSRLSYAEIGRKISLSQSATKERVQNLTDTGVIKSFTADVDYGLLGYSLKVIIHLKFKNDEFRRFIDHLKQFPEIISCKRITGEYCLIAECILKDSAHLENIIDRLIKFGIPSTSVQLSEIKTNRFFQTQ
ncbi:Lrp/AsnC family transcriptional regulator [Chryseobacterium oranimense]|uniref:Lrp/AsnC family transcriptional regulator n=1 Tax=Chryseobacterium oranimense TaxID=421058 RepID=UPI0021AEBB14|nr:Lrp/AsnC family transcriptional regulator [Chryseobacterium oranimense]UWX61596.1 Lrp/AsnC family transcriptional regulator [Chryseobacterium oranimense]